MVFVASSDVIKRLVVLIADSKPHSRFLLRSMLLQLEVRNIHEAADGSAALDAINSINPDILILDWNLNGLTARDVLRLMRSQSPNSDPALRTIIVSSSGEYRSVQEAMGLGAPHFMVWPISPKMLEHRLRGIVTDAREMARVQKSEDPLPGVA